MMGAQGRLLPPSVPYRFFIASAAYHIAAWVLVFLANEQVLGYQGGPGYVPGALHALTLGVFAMSAIGASFQIIPVVTNQTPARLWPLQMVSWLFIPGVGVLIGGFIAADELAMSVGGVLAAAGLGLYAVLMLRMLLRSGGFRVLSMHIRFAFVSLVLFVTLGLGMIFDFLPFYPMASAVTHGAIAIFGFMGLLAMGFGSILIPMFALANPAAEGRSLFILAIYGAGLVLAAAGAIGEWMQIAVIGSGLLLVGAVAHVVAMTGLLKTGMKKRLGLSFVLIRISWVFLLLCIALGVTAISGIPFEPAFLLAAFIAIFGWLLTFVLGVKQQIMPFLAAMNVSKLGGKPPRLSELGNAQPLKIHAVCHFLAFALVGIGIATEMEVPVQAGAAIGLIGAVAFLWFTLDVYRRIRANARAAKSEGSAT